MEPVKELDQVVLSRDLPDFGLCAGDVGTVVMIHEQGKGYEVEFLTLDGETVAVTTLMADDIRPIARKEVAHARLLTT